MAADLIESTPTIKYRDIRGFKYQLAEDFSIETGIIPFAPVQHRYIGLSETGKLTVRAGLFWDGPSGPTYDTPLFCRAALGHDGLYRLMKSGDLDISFRKQADDLMYKLYVEDLEIWFKDKMAEEPLEDLPDLSGASLWKRFFTIIKWLQVRGRRLLYRLIYRFGRFRAYYCWAAVRLFGRGSAR